MKKIAVSLFAIFLLLIGCKDDNIIVNPPSEIPEIVPLKVGNTWSYQTTVYDTSGNIVSTTVDSFSVIADTIINGQKRFIFSTGVIRWNNVFGFWITMSPDSVLFFKYPANVGDEYGYGLKVICKDSTIVVPGGAFKCYGYSVNVAIDYVSPGVGLVKEEWYKDKLSGDKYLYQKQELLDYRLN